MVGDGGDARLAQLAGHLFGLLAGAAVDDRRQVGGVAQAGLQQRLAARGAALALERDDVEGEVRAVEAGANLERLAHPEAGGDLPRHRHRCGRRAGHHRWPPQPLDHLGQAQVVGAEVVPPLGDAVRLVHRDQVDLAAGERFEEDFRGEPLGSAVDDPRLPSHRLQCLGNLPIVHPRSDHRHLVPAGIQLPPLIPHQGDQGTDHDRQLLRGKPRQLVAEALSTPGRHHDQRVAALQRRDHGLALPWPPPLVTQLVQQIVSPFPRFAHLAQSSGSQGLAHWPVPRVSFSASAGPKVPRS